MSKKPTTKKNQYIRFVTPKGRAKYPKLDQPYSFNRKLRKSMPDPKGNYEVILIVQEDEAQDLITAINAAIEQSGLEPENLPYKEGDEPGTIEFKFRAYGQDQDGKRKKLPMVDAKAQPIKKVPVIYSGSTMRISGWISVAELGARLNIREVQLIRLVQGQSSFGAVEDEDGYEYDPDEEDDNEDEGEEEEGSVEENDEDASDF